MKIVHINQTKIRADKAHEEFLAVLRTQWDEAGRRRAKKKHAALLEQQNKLNTSYV